MGVATAVVGVALLVGWLGVCKTVALLLLLLLLAMGCALASKLLGLGCR